MSNTVVKNSGGIGFFGLLFIVFLTLKLTNVIAWSWIWVTAPLWAPFVVVLVILLIMFLGLVLAESSKRK